MRLFNTVVLFIYLNLPPPHGVMYVHFTVISRSVIWRSTVSE